MLQSLFTWIFYLFNHNGNGYDNLVIASILIHLDFLSIYNVMSKDDVIAHGFNPYSPGFSIYLMIRIEYTQKNPLLQSLFTWIFYLFSSPKSKSQKKINCFNPYSPGFSIYLKKVKNKNIL